MFSKMTSSSTSVASPTDPKKAIDDLKQIAATKKNPSESIDEFNTGTLDDSFLDDAPPSKSNKKTPAKPQPVQNDDSDSDDGNPMVAKDEDLDEPEPPKITKPQVVKQPAAPKPEPVKVTKPEPKQAPPAKVTKPQVMKVNLTRLE
jgi:hypothetical protein